MSVNNVGVVVTLMDSDLLIERSVDVSALNVAIAAAQSRDVIPVLAAVCAVVALTTSAAALIVMLPAGPPPVVPRRCSLPETLLAPVVHDPAVHLI